MDDMRQQLLEVQRLLEVWELGVIHFMQYLCDEPLEKLPLSEQDRPHAQKTIKKIRAAKGNESSLLQDEAFLRDAVKVLADLAFNGYYTNGHETEMFIGRLVWEKLPLPLHPYRHTCPRPPRW